MNPNVMQITQINLRGNTMDHGWFRHITLENGKPYMVAITVLSEIFYWYRATEVKSEQDGSVAYKQKFRADKLQKSYQQLADTFGFTKRQVTEACKYLKEKGYITLEFRNIFSNGTCYNNVMFVEPVPEAIKRISTLYHSNVIPPTPEGESLPHYNGTPSHIITGEAPTLERGTYTKITTENTTKITTDKKNSPADYPQDVIPFKSSDNSICGGKDKNTIPYKEIVQYLNGVAGTGYKPTSKDTQRLIKARWKEGFRLDDFKLVVDKKTAEWLNHPEMSVYLRPATLFGTKFESYLNQPVKGGTTHAATAGGFTIPGFKGQLDW